MGLAWRVLLGGGGPSPLVVVVFVVPVMCVVLRLRPRGRCGFVARIALPAFVFSGFLSVFHEREEVPSSWGI